MKYLYTLIIYITLFSQRAFADGWVLGWLENKDGQNTTDRIRNWDIHLSDLWNILKYAIDWMMWFAGTIAVIAIIIGAYKILFGSIAGDTNKWKEYITGALIWFAIAALAWFFVKLIIDNFS